MTNESKQVYAPAAEVVGMAMALMSDLEMGEVERDWQEQYADNIAKMLQAVKPDKFINCVWSMQRHHPAIVDKSVNLFAVVSAVVLLLSQC